MFGNDDQKDAPNNNANNTQDSDLSAPLPPSDPTDDSSLALDDKTTGDASDDATISAPSSSIGDPTPPPNTTLVSDASSAKPGEPSAPTHATGPTAHDDLLDIKQNALQQLSPLVGHLDQSPEEKFRTLMMMIQASDDQGLVKE